MNRDTWIGIVGAVVLVGAMVAVFQYERTAGAARLGIGGGSWSLATMDGPDADGRTVLGASTDAVLAINATRLVNVTFTLGWTAGQGSDTLSLEVQPPDGVAAPAAVSGDSGTLTLTVAVPNGDPSTGDAGGLGVGNWTATVTFVSASGLLPGPAPPVGGDGNVAWTLATELQGYTQAAPPGP